MSTNELEERVLTPDDYEAIVALWRRAGLNSIRPQGRDSRAAFVRQLASSGTGLIGISTLAEAVPRGQMHAIRAG